MAQAGTPKNSANQLDKENGQTGQKGASKRNKPGSGKSKSAKTNRGRKDQSSTPSWLVPVVSLISAGVAVGASLYATRDRWMSKNGDSEDDFSAAFANDETDFENFDQTRHAGVGSMRDDPGDDWCEVDDMSDASFPASDPPSFTPGTAS